MATEVLRDHYQRLTGSARFHGALRVAGPVAERPRERAAQLELAGVKR